MPNNSSGPLEWNEDNFSKVLAEVYREAETDEALRSQLLTDPFAVLKARVDVPEDYKGGIFAREKKKPIMMLYVPIQGTASEAMPEGTSDAEPQPDFEPICTVWTIW